MSGCAASPTSVVNTYIVYVSHTSYTASPITYLYDRASQLVAWYQTFSNLPVTLFQPGDLIPFVYLFKSFHLQIGPYRIADRRWYYCNLCVYHLFGII